MGCNYTINRIISPYRPFPENMESTDSILLVQLKNNSSEAFDTLYNKYSGRLFNFILRISGKDKYLTEEIIQRVFIRIWETRHYIDVSQSFVAYLTVIARNMLINELNHKMVEYIYENYVISSNEDEAYSEDGTIDFFFLTRYLDKIIEELPPATREVCLLNLRQSHTIKEIASLLNKSESTIEKQLSKGKIFIRKRLQQDYEKIFTICLLISVL